MDVPQNYHFNTFTRDRAKVFRKVLFSDQNCNRYVSILIKAENKNSYLKELLNRKITQPRVKLYLSYNVLRNSILNNATTSTEI